MEKINKRSQNKYISKNIQLNVELQFLSLSMYI